VADPLKAKARTKATTTVTLTESEIATIEALSMLFNLVIGLRDAKQVVDAFDSRIEQWSKASKPKTAAMLALMKQLATDPKMLKARRQRAILRHSAPRGRA
jgi:hypothetical protein